MNWQFFATAGIISAILLVVALVMFFCIVMDYFSYTAEEVFRTIMCICFLLPIAFWFVIGVVCGLNAVWGWGLVK